MQLYFSSKAQRRRRRIQKWFCRGLVILSFGLSLSAMIIDACLFSSECTKLVFGL